MDTTARGRAHAAAAALLLSIASGATVSEAAAGGARTDVSPTYLALGDSIPFGLDPRLVPPVPFSCFSCGTFTARAVPPGGDVFVGYPEYLRDRLGLALVNAACPGETTASFDARIRVGQAAICAEFKSEDWLHASYDGSQRRYALDLLARRRVELVTLQLGANDVLDLVGACGGDAACVNAGIGGVLLRAYATVTDVLSSIRGAGYQGPIAVAGYYAPSPEWTALVSGLNQYLALAAAHAGAVPVDLQTPFGPDPCGAGLLLPVDPANPAAGCDVHPSEAGARLIAATIAAALGR